MKQVAQFLAIKFLALAALVVGQAMYAQAPAAVGKDVPELMRQLEQKKLNPAMSMNMWDKKLQRAQLVNADLSDANLSRSDLSNANLSAANIGVNGPIPSGGPDLTNANLSGATLTQTNFSTANLTKVNFTNCKGFETTIIDKFTDFQGAIGLTPEQKAYARSKGTQNVPN